MSRCDSAAMVPNTRELLPDPDTPVNAVSRRLGISTLTSLRLFSRAPWTRIRSWLSATGGDGVSAVADVVPLIGSSPSRSVALLELLARAAPARVVTADLRSRPCLGSGGPVPIAGDRGGRGRAGGRGADPDRRAALGHGTRDG